jgi:hypothetical protein
VNLLFVGKSVGNKKNIITDEFTDGKGSQKNYLLHSISISLGKYRM